jgi:translation elongation factor EF-1beta
MYVTTLYDFLKALPEELKITANFLEATVEITQLEDVKKAAAGELPAGFGLRSQLRKQHRDIKRH